MVENAVVAAELETAERLVHLLERDGFRLDAAVWVVDEEGHGRLYLVPHDRNETELRQTIRVAYTISENKDDLPDRHDLRYSVVGLDHPVVQAVRSVGVDAGKVRGAYKNGTYVDTAYVLPTTA
jgi:hypothetical protein